MRLTRTRPLTIRRRVVLSFVAINILFGINVCFYAWSNYRRKVTIDELRSSVTAGKLITDIQTSLNNIQKQVTLLSQSVVDSGTGASPEEIAAFKAQLEDIRREIAELRRDAGGGVRDRAAELEKRYAELSASWLVFYENFGVRHATAIMEMAVRAEPLSQLLLLQTLPALLEAEKRDGDAATANFERVARLTDRLSLALFILSGLLAAAIAYRLSHYLTTVLGELKLGAARIGAGKFDRKIQLNSQDELGDLAGAFNDMSENLRHANEQLTSAHAELEARHEQVERQRRISDSLLLNILPEQIAAELRENEAVEPKYFEDVTILFTDFVGFTLSTEKLAAEELVSRLNEYFTAFDQITSRYGIEKMKTIGDAYMCVGGLPSRSPSHPVDVVLAAFEMVKAVEDLARRPGSPGWSVRIGIHTGPVIAGVVGIRKFAFDVWGDSVNYSSRLESSGAPNRINLSDRTYSRVKDFFVCRYRGKVATKEKREVDMYFAEGLLPELAGDGSESPPAAFLRRYRIYFQKAPPSFPDFLARGSTPAPAASQP